MQYIDLLNELHGIHQHRKSDIPDVDALVRFMESQGYHSIGGGEFSYVFARSDNEVIKVFNDACYERFIALVRKHPENPHFPKFKGNSVRLNSKARMIRIEHLAPIEMTDPIVRQTRLFQSMISQWHDDPEFKGMWEYPPELEGYKDAIELIMEANPEGSQCRMDLHEGNIMKRGSVPVIIDPYASVSYDGWGSGIY